CHECVIHKTDGRLALDVVVTKDMVVFELVSTIDQLLLVCKNTYLVLNKGFHFLNMVTEIDIQKAPPSRDGLDVYLHFSSKARHKIEDGIPIDFVIMKGTAGARPPSTT
nr:hypothetical protein [Tanacetum cinerariifolium]